MTATSPTSADAVRFQLKGGGELFSANLVTVSILLSTIWVNIAVKCKHSTVV